MRIFCFASTSVVATFASIVEGSSAVAAMKIHPEQCHLECAGTKEQAQ